MEEIKKLPVVESALKYTKITKYTLPIKDMKNLKKEEFINRVEYCINNNLLYSEKYFECEKNLKENDNKDIIKLIIQTLEYHKFDYKKMYYNRIKHIKERKEGKTFTYNDHLKALIISQLKNNRWDYYIDDKNMELNDIFDYFDRDFILSKDKKYFLDSLKEINCTNNMISNIIDSFYYNIKIFDKITKEYGSLDIFIFSKDTTAIISDLREGKYKLKQVGTSVAIDYLNRVGVNVANISKKSLNLLSKSKLNILDNPTRTNGLGVIKRLSEMSKKSEIEIECILNYFTNKKYSNICTDNPKCENCKLKHICNRGK